MTRPPRPTGDDVAAAIKDRLLWAPLLTGLGLVGLILSANLIPDHPYPAMFVSAVVMAIGATAWWAEIR